MNELSLSDETNKSLLEAQNIETLLKIAVEKSIKITIEEARFFFKDESEIHGYLRCALKQCFKENDTQRYRRKVKETSENEAITLTYDS